MLACTHRAAFNPERLHLKVLRCAKNEEMCARVSCTRAPCTFCLPLQNSIAQACRCRCLMWGLFVL